MADTSIVVKLINETQAGFNQINRDLTSIKSGLSSVASAFGAAFAVGNIVKIANEVQQLDNKVKLVSSSSEDFAKKYQTVYNIAQKTATPLNDLGDLYTKLSRSQETAKISAEQVGQVTETFANVIKVSGTSAAGASSAILQFSQAMQSGRLSGDEFRTILEQTPVLLDVMSKTLGVTQGQLRELAKDQKLTSEIVAQSMLLMGDEIELMAMKMDTTLSQAFTKLQNSLQNSVRDFLANSEAADVATKALEYLTANMDNILPVLGVVVVALTGIAAVLAGPWVAGFAAAVAIGVSFADTFGPVAKQILVLLYDGFVGVAKQVAGFTAALIELAKGNFTNVFNAYDQAVLGVENSLGTTTKSQTKLNL
jgi:tape measure domain-containing protein